MMIRHGPLYVKLENEWSTLCDKLYEKENYRYRYDVMENARVLVLPKPTIQKYILYRSICDAFFKTPTSIHHLNNLFSKIESISAQVIQQVINDSSRPAGSLLQPSGSEASDQVAEVGLEHLYLIYFIIKTTSLEQNVFDRNCKDELVFKSEENQTLYKYYFDLVQKLSE